MTNIIKKYEKMNNEQLDKLFKSIDERTDSDWPYIAGWVDGDGFIGKIEETINLKLTDDYKNFIRQFQERIASKIGELGYVNGNIVHYWHGKKADRRYFERWSILIENKYNPHSDIKKDWQGLYTLNTNKPKLKKDIQTYFILRNEDSIDE